MWHPTRFRPTPLPPWAELGVPPELQTANEAVFEAQSECKAKEIMNIRVVGYALIFLHYGSAILGATAVTYLRNWILLDNSSASTFPVDEHSAGVERVYEIGEFLMVHWLRVYDSKTAPVTPPVCTSSFDCVVKKRVKGRFAGSSPNGHSTAKIRALWRDDFRCVISRKLDYNFLEADEGLFEESEAPGSAVVNTECCHIFTQSAIDSLHHSEAKEGYVPNAFGILRAFGLAHIADDFMEEEGIHSLRNILTVDNALHRLFGDLRMWLEPILVENQYALCFVNPATANGQTVDEGQVVAFELSARGQKYLQKPDCSVTQLPLPDPKLLALHAACAKVAHMSGAADHFLKIDRDFEDGTVLNQDGSTMFGDMLTYRLAEAAAQHQ